MLIRILKVAGLWISEDDENYEPLQHVESDIPRSLTPEEQERFLHIAKRLNELVYCYSVLGIHATLSTIEERNLQIGDINLDNGILLVRSRSAKNKYRVRTIPLTDEACWAARRLIEMAGERGSVSPQHFLFPFRMARDQFNPDKPMTVSGLKRPWNEIRMKAGVPWFPPYGLRHTGCTRFAEDGMPIHVLLSMAGHMSRKMQQHYIHISEVAKKRAVKHAYGPSWEDRKREKMRVG
jgi:integrase